MENQERNNLFIHKKIFKNTEKRDLFCCWTFFAWFFTLGTFSFIILIIIYNQAEYNKEDQEKTIIFIPFGVLFYFLYLIIEFCMPTSSLILSKTKEGILERMNSCFKGLPSISIEGIAYHKEHQKENTSVVNTYRIKKNTNYKYCKDISGLLNLDNINNNNTKKYYVQLKLLEEVHTEDQLIIQEYESAYNYLIEEIKNKDKYYKVLEAVKIEWINYYNMFKLQDDEHCFTETVWSIFSIFLGLAEIYKLYINCISIKKTYTIKKIISKENILNDERYNSYIPEIYIKNQSFRFNGNNLIMNNNLNNNQSNDDLNLDENNIIIQNKNIKQPQINNKIYNEQVNMSQINVKVNQNN